MKNKKTLPKELLLLLETQNNLISFLEDSVDTKLERCDQWLMDNNNLYNQKEYLVELLEKDGWVISDEELYETIKLNRWFIND